MIWCKTDAGRVEMQTRALVKERSQRTLLLLIDGVKSEEMMLANVVGLKPEDFKFLESLQLIAPVVSTTPSRFGGLNTAPMPLSDSRPAPLANSQPAPLEAPVGAPRPAHTEAQFLDYAQFTATLTKLISSELGLRGFTLTLAVEKASSIEELRQVADRVIGQIRDRKGEPTAEKARQALFGG